MTADERFYCFRTREKYLLLLRIKTYTLFYTLQDCIYKIMIWSDICRKICISIFTIPFVLAHSWRTCFFCILVDTWVSFEIIPSRLKSYTSSSVSPVLSLASSVIQGIYSNHQDWCPSVFRGESSFLLDWIISIWFTLNLEWYVVLFKHVVEDLMFMQGEIWFFR